MFKKIKAKLRLKYEAFKIGIKRISYTKRDFGIDVVSTAVTSAVVLTVVAIVPSIPALPIIIVTVALSNRLTKALYRESMMAIVV